MEPKLDELLARLRELDPETWNRLMEFLPAQINRFQDLWILQGVIQDAIAARFWRFEISYNIWSSYDAYIFYRDRDGWQHDIAMPVAEGIAPYERCKMPAEALLQAYVAALEATR